MQNFIHTPSLFLLSSLFSLALVALGGDEPTHRPVPLLIDPSCFVCGVSIEITRLHENGCRVGRTKSVA